MRGRMAWKTRPRGSKPRCTVPPRTGTPRQSTVCQPLAPHANRSARLKVPVKSCAVEIMCSIKIFVKSLDLNTIFDYCNQFIQKYRECTNPIKNVLNTRCHLDSSSTPLTDFLFPFSIQIIGRARLPKRTKRSRRHQIAARILTLSNIITLVE